MDLKDFIKERRLDLGLSMKKVAEHVGVSEGTISRWESGNIKNMRRDKIIALAEVLQVPAFALMDTNAQIVMASRVKERRELLNMSIDDVVYEMVNIHGCDISEKEFKSIENKDGQLPQEIISALCNVLQTSPSYLYGWLNEKQSNESRQDDRLLEAVFYLLEATYGYANYKETLDGDLILRVGTGKNMLELNSDIVEICSDMLKFIAPGVLEYAIKEFDKRKDDSNNTCDNLVFMTYYNKLAAAGNGEYLFDDIPTSTIEVDKELAKGADFVIGVNGDSMQPTFSDGDKVLVKKQDTIKIGEIGIFIDGNDCYIKEKGKNCLVSHNKEYGIIPGTDTMRCVGKVIGKV